MQKQSFLKGLVLGLMVLTSVFIWQWKVQQENHHAESVHYHAGFLVYVDGVKQDFSDFKYMNFTPCSEHAKKLTPQEAQIEKAHLHDGVGDVVHVHATGGVWGDLFKNIGYTFPAGLPVTALRGTEEIKDVLHEPIAADDSIVILVGDSGHANLGERVTLEHIKAIESKSELCGTAEE